MMLSQFRKIAFFMAYVVATIPLWHYIRDGHILALMTVVVAFAYLNVVISTVEVAQPILTSEKAKVPLPRWLPDKPKYHKWWMLVRRTMRWHLLLIPPKMGLALGYVHWLHYSAWRFGHGMLNPYYYMSHNHSPSIVYPQQITILIGGLVIILMTLFELGLLSAIVVNSRGKLLRVIITKFMIIALFAGLSHFFTTAVWLGEPCTSYCGRYLSLHTARRIDDTVRLATNTFTENGVLLAANIMRPVGKGTAFTQKYYKNELGEWIDISGDNRPFVARQIVAGILGLLLYTGATWVVLWFIEDEA